MNNENINNILFQDNCIHYERGCKILAPCCNKFFHCRLCHDIETYDDEMNIKKIHKINRYNIKKILCKTCNFLQDVSQYCINCGECMGKYFCNICNFFDNRENYNYFHCSECKMCRIGIKENMIHCDKCGCCFNKNYHDTTKCTIEKSSHADCPICFEELFTSVKPYIQLNCGHMIHIECNNLYSKTNDKCPICCKSLYTSELKNLFIKNMIENNPMPEEYANTHVNILCNDCCEKNIVKLHFIAMECPKCNSYNTKKI